MSDPTTAPNPDERSTGADASAPDSAAPAQTDEAFDKKFYSSAKIEKASDYHFPEADVPPPRPPRRPFWLGILAVGVCSWFMVDMIDDLTYSLSGETPNDLGEAVDIQAPPSFETDSFVKIKGICNFTKKVQLNYTIGSAKQVCPLMGSPFTFVEIKPPEEKEIPVDEAFAEKRFIGRARFMEDMTYFPTLRDFASRTFGTEIPSGAFVIVDGETPKSLSNIQLYYLLFGLIVLMNVILVIRGFSRR